MLCIIKQLVMDSYQNSSFHIVFTGEMCNGETLYMKMKMKMYILWSKCTSRPFSKRKMVVKHQARDNTNKKAFTEGLNYTITRMTTKDTLRRWYMNDRKKDKQL